MPARRSTGIASSAPTAAATTAPTIIPSSTFEPSAETSWAVVNARCPANVAWHSEIWPAMPVMTVIDRKITEYTSVSVRSESQNASARCERDVHHDDRTKSTPRMWVERVNMALRLADASDGGGGSAPESGSVASRRLRSPGQNSSRRNSAANGSDGLRPCAMRLAGGR